MPPRSQPYRLEWPLTPSKVEGIDEMFQILFDDLSLASKPAGPIGLPGNTGLIGPVGQEGDEGPQGPPGLTGLPGLAGLMGPQGLPGDDGADGSIGPPGSSGIPGETGLMGLQGLPGDDGDNGFPGPPGPAGAVGATGDTGATGPAGVAIPVPGEDGDDGWVVPGVQGRDGMDGVTGATGQMGPPGIDGENGDSTFICPETTGSFMSGSILFAGPSSAIAQNNSNLFWDDTNKRLGIGTTGPGAKLDLTGSGTTDASGTSGLWIKKSNTNSLLKLTAGGGADTTSVSIIQSADYANTINYYGGSPNTSFNLALNPYGGNVGIGTTSPSSKLSIVGLPTSTAGLVAGDIWVDTTGGLNILKIV